MRNTFMELYEERTKVYDVAGFSAGGFRELREFLSMLSKNLSSEEATELVCSLIGDDDELKEVITDMAIGGGINWKLWKLYGFNRKDAKKWAMYGFNPPEAEAWKFFGFKPSEAAEWQFHRFRPSEAEDWKFFGFNPPEAEDWASHGFKAVAATELKEQGIKANEVYNSL